MQVQKHDHSLTNKVVQAVLVSVTQILRNVSALYSLELAPSWQEHQAAPRRHSAQHQHTVSHLPTVFGLVVRV